MDTCAFKLLTISHHHIHSLKIKRHNKAVWALKILLVSSKQFRCYILMNAKTFNNNSQKIWSHHGYFHTHANTKDVTIMQDLNQTSYALKDYNTNQTLWKPLITTSKYNLLNFHIAMKNSLSKSQLQKLKNINHL